MKNILVTGGSGFIGSNLSLKLVEKGYVVTVLDSLSPQIHGDNQYNSPLFKSIKGKVRFIEGSVTKKKDWLNALLGQDAIIHLASETGTGQSMYEIERYNEVNVLGTTLMLDIIANTSSISIKKIVVASSRAIYGEGKYYCREHGDVYPSSRKDQDMRNGDFNVKCPFCEKDVEVRGTAEDSIIHPTSVYGFTKHAQEELSMIVGRSLNIPVVTLRYQNVYGPGQSLSNPYTGILSVFSTRIRNGNYINIFEDGKESRDFIYIDDVVAGTILSLENPNANYNVFNIGTGMSIDVQTVAEVLMGNLGVEVNLNVSGNYRIGDIRHNFADIGKATKLLGFSPKISFSDGISCFSEWVLKQDIQQDKYEKSINEMKIKGLYR